MLDWIRNAVRLLFWPFHRETKTQEAEGPDKYSMADFLLSLAKKNPEVRDAMDDIYLELQTDEAPNGDRHKMYQTIRDGLNTFRDDESKQEP